MLNFLIFLFFEPAVRVLIVFVVTVIYRKIIIGLGGFSLSVLYRGYGDGGIVMIIFTSDSRRAEFIGYSVIIVVSKIFSNFDDVSSKGIILYFSSLMNSMIAADSFSVGDSILRVRRDRDKNV